MKWLISKNNSAWGIKKDGQGNQYYSHVIDFPEDQNDKNKDIFLNKYIFNTTDWKKDIENQIDTAYNIQDSNKTTFQIDIKNYPNETIDTLLNKDFAVCLDESSGKKIYSFWAIEGTAFQNRQIIEYIAVRDWIFEKGINNLFKNNSQVKLERAHINDITSDNRWNINMNSDNSLVEKLEDLNENCYYPTKTSKLLIDYYDDINVPNEQNRLYWYKEKDEFGNRDDSIYFYDFNTKKVSKYLVNISNGGVLQWFTTYEDKNGKWHLVWAYYKWVSGSDYELVFVDDNLTGTPKQQSFYSSPLYNENKSFYMDLGNKELFALIGNQLKPKVVWLKDWINGDSSSIRNEFIRFTSSTGDDLHSVIPGVIFGMSLSSRSGVPIITYSVLGICNISIGFNLLYNSYNGDNVKTIERNIFCFGINAPDTSIIWHSKTFIGDSFDTGEIVLFAGVPYSPIGGLPRKDNFYYKSDSTKDFSKLDFVKFENNYLSGITNSYYNDGEFGYYHNGKYNFYNPGEYCVIGISEGNVICVHEDQDHYLRINEINIHQSKEPYQYLSYIKMKTNVNITKEEVNNLLNNTAFAIVTCQLKDNKLRLGNTDESNDLKFTNPAKINMNMLGTKIEQNYYSFLLPFEKITYKGVSFNFNLFQTIYPIINSSSYIYSIRLQPFGLFPVGKYQYNILGEGNNWRVEIEEKTNSKSFVPIRVESSLGSSEWLFKKEVEAYDNETPSKEINNASNYNLNIFNEFIENNIAKLHRNPYVKDYLKTNNGLEMFIYPQVLTNKYNIQLSYTWAHDNNHIIFKIKDLDNEQGYYNQEYTYGLLGQEINNYEFLLTNEQYNQYMITNRNQLEQRSRKWEIDKQFAKENLGWALAKQIGAALAAAAAAAAAPFTGGASLALAAGATIAGNAASSAIGIGSTITNYRQQMANIENNIAMQAMMLSDLKNAPNTLKGNGDDMNGVITKTSLTPLLIHEELWPNLKSDIAWYFQQYGSLINNKPRDINNYLTNKYHFNFIQAQSAFENYREDNALNNITRQIIDKSLNEGITIWHFRDDKTFKGIKNWNVNNVDYNTLTDIKIDTKDIEIKEDTEIDIPFELIGNIKNISYKVDNTQIAWCNLVDNKLRIKGLISGNTFVIINSKSGFEYKINIKVIEGDKIEIDIDKSDFNLEVFKDTFIIKSETRRIMNFKEIKGLNVQSENSDISTVEVNEDMESIIVTAVAKGKTRIELDGSNVRNIVYINVNVTEIPLEIDIDKSDINVKVGDIIYRDIKNYDKIKNLKAKSFNPSIFNASIVNNGKQLQIYGQSKGSQYAQLYSDNTSNVNIRVNVS